MPILSRLILLIFFAFKFKLNSVFQPLMSSFIEAICCCFYPTFNNLNPEAIIKKAHQKSKRLPKPSRIISVYQITSIRQISKSQKLEGIPVHTCPICTCFFNKILACNNCENTICRKCVRQYEKKYSLSSQNMRCPFCNSQKSLFIDYEKQPKRYFDTSGKDKMKRQTSNKVEKQNICLQMNQINNSKAEMKKQEEQTSGIPTERNDLPLRQINVINVLKKNSKERESLERSTQESSQVAMLNPNREENPENQDLRHIEQFQMRTESDMNQ